MPHGPPGKAYLVVWKVGVTRTYVSLASQTLLPESKESDKPCAEKGLACETTTGHAKSYAGIMGAGLEFNYNIRKKLQHVVLQSQLVISRSWLGSASLGSATQARASLGSFFLLKKKDQREPRLNQFA